jgi:SEC-C motif-containing protein
MIKIGRNDPCPCGSGLKHKRCCGVAIKGPQKPVGTTGMTVLSFRQEAASAAFQELDFPSTKDGIERFIVRGFLCVGQRERLLPPVNIQASQNGENDFDFSLRLEDGKMKSLELMELAPIDRMRRSYEGAPTSYEPYAFAKQIHTNLMGKATRYRTSSGNGLWLLIYVTDWHFVLHERVLELLQYWTASNNHCFEAIYCYSPITPEDGIVQLIYPCAREKWAHVDAETYKGRVIYNFDPRGWQVVAPQNK